MKAGRVPTLGAAPPLSSEPPYRRSAFHGDDTVKRSASEARLCDTLEQSPLLLPAAPNLKHTARSRSCCFSSGTAPVAFPEEVSFSLLIVFPALFQSLTFPTVH